LDQYKCPVIGREVRSMEGFSNVVLESTLELATEAMSHDGRVGECVEGIRRCLKSSADPQHDNDLRSAVTALLEIAVQQHQFLIAKRLMEIARQLRR